MKQQQHVFSCLYSTRSWIASSFQCVLFTDQLHRWHLAGGFSWESAVTLRNANLSLFCLRTSSHAPTTITAQITADGNRNNITSTEIYKCYTQYTVHVILKLLFLDKIFTQYHRSRITVFLNISRWSQPSWYLRFFIFFLLTIVVTKSHLNILLNGYAFINVFFI